MVVVIATCTTPAPDSIVSSIVVIIGMLIPVRFIICVIVAGISVSTPRMISIIIHSASIPDPGILGCRMIITIVRIGVILCISMVVWVICRPSRCILVTVAV